MHESHGGGGAFARLLERLGRHLFASQAAQTRAFRNEIEELRVLVQRLGTKVDQVAASQKQLDKVLSNQKVDEKFRQIFRGQLSALIRAQYLSTDLPAPLALQARRFRLRSQNEEDGIILALFEAVGVETRRFVEIGSGGSGGNSAVLAHDLGWTGLMVDASKRAVRVATHEFRSRPGVQVARAFVDTAGVNTLLESHGMTGAIDLLSIDIDSIDYWLLQAITACTARVLIVEYNAHFGPSRAVTLPNAPPPSGAPLEYFGASLAALNKAAEAQGYRLVLCENSGVNAFFVRRDLAPGLPTLPVDVAYRPFRHRLRDEDEVRTPDDVFAQIQSLGLPLVEV